MFAELFSAKIAKKGAPDLMIYNVSGTPFWKVEMLTWCNGIPSFSKVKKRASQTLRFTMSGAPFSAKSAKKERLRPYDLQCFRNAISGSRFFDLVTMKSRYSEK